MIKVTIQFNNGKTMSYRAKYDIRNLQVCTLHTGLLLRYQHIALCKKLLHTYLANSSDLADYFGAAILKIKTIDGRTKEAKGLPYFSVEEYLANFQ